MILYSVVPSEIVFHGMNDAETIKYIEAGYRGERVQVMQAAGNCYTIMRLLSTNPSAFLDPELQPGKLVQGKNLEF
jgi:hypothetical protein